MQKSGRCCVAENKRVTTALELEPQTNEKSLVRAWNSLRAAALSVWQKGGEETGVAEEISARLKAGTIDSELKGGQTDRLRTQTQRESAQLAREEELFALEKEALALQNEKTRQEIEKIRDDRLLAKIRVFQDAGYKISVRDFNGSTTLFIEDELTQD